MDPKYSNVVLRNESNSLLVYMPTILEAERCTPIFRILGLQFFRKIEAPKIPTGLKKIQLFEQQSKTSLTGFSQWIYLVFVIHYNKIVC